MAKQGAKGLYPKDFQRLIGGVSRALGLKTYTWQEIPMDDVGSYTSSKFEKATHSDMRILGFKAFEIEGKLMR